MKSIYHFIIEKLQLNNQSKLNSKLNWSIKDAKDGDIITFKENDLYLVFIFYSIEKDKSNDQVFAYAFYSVNDDGGWPTEYLDSTVLSIMALNRVSEENFYLSNEEEKQLLFNNLKKDGLKWDPIKKEIEEI